MKIAVYGMIAFFGLFSFPPHVSTQALPSSPFFTTKTLGRITAVLDTNSGRFSVCSNDGKSLLWYGGSSLTSHISVKIGNKHFSNYRWSILGNDPRMTCLGKGTPEMLGDRLRYTWNLETRDGMYTLTEELIPVLDSIRNEVRVRVSVENHTGVTTGIGIAIQMDVNAAGEDGVQLGLNGAWSDRETILRGAEVPNSWKIGSGAYSPDSAGGRLRGDGVSTPDIFLSGQWASHSFLGTALYGYEGREGRKIWDAAVFVQWDERDVSARTKRVETTAVGFDKDSHTDDEKGPTSLGRRFILPWACMMYLASDSTTQVHIEFQDDSEMENKATWDGKWDTTVVVHANKPDTLRLYTPLAAKDPFFFDDSVAWYRYLVILVSSDKPIGIVANHRGDPAGYDLFWPMEESDTEYLMHGDLGYGVNTITTMDRETTIRFTSRQNTTHINTLNPRKGYNLLVLPDSTVEIRLPSQASIWMELNYFSRRHDWPHPNPVPDGAGSLLEADYPVQVHRMETSDLMGSWTSEGGVLGHHTDFMPTRKQLGTEHVVVPYEKLKAIRKEDFIRILAYEDSTSVSIFEHSPPMMLNRGETIDTLLDAPRIIRTSKSVAISQRALHWSYSNPPNVFCDNAGMTPLLPVKLWGRKYFCFTGMAQKQEDFHCEDIMDSHYYVRIISRSEFCDSITLDGHHLDPNTFTAIGEYSWADIDRSVGPCIVSSPNPCLVILYGWSNTLCNRVRNSWGEAFIPPFK